MQKRQENPKTDISLFFVCLFFRAYEVRQRKLSYITLDALYLALIGNKLGNAILEFAMYFKQKKMSQKYKYLTLASL